MAQLEEIKSKYAGLTYLKNYFDQKYFGKTCNDSYIHEFWQVINRLNLWKRIENWLQILEEKYKEPQEIKSFF